MKDHFFKYLLLIIFILLSACTKEHTKARNNDESKIVNSLFQETFEQLYISKANDDKKDLTWLYSQIASQYMAERKMDEGKLYLDSATLHLKYIERNNDKAFYYHIYGDFYNYKMNDSLSHEYYYMAKEHYDEDDANMIPVLANLSISYINRNDTINLKETMDKMLSISKSQNNATNLIYSYKMAYYYYESLYRLRSTNRENMLDSALYYAQEVVKEYEQDNSIQQSHIVSYDYIALAEIILKKEGTNLDSARYYADRAKEYMLPTDTMMMINILHLKAKYEYKTNQLDSCISTCEEQFVLLTKWSIATTNLPVYYEIFSLLGEVSVKQNDYKSALLYEQEKNRYQDKLQNAEKYKIIEELREKYETEQKDKKIEFEKSAKELSRKINYLFLGIFLILIVLSYFISKWYKAKKENTEIALKLVEEEYKELEHKYAIRKIEVENAEHKWRQAEIDKFSQDISLKDAQSELNRLRRIERSLDQQDKCWHLREMDTLLIEKSSTFKQPVEKYIGRMGVLKNNYIERLKNKDITPGQRLYCIAFVIIMDVNDIASCFDIQVDSVKKIKNKIKYDLAVEPEISLEEYLYNLTLDKPDEKLL